MWGEEPSSKSKPRVLRVVDASKMTCLVSCIFCTRLYVKIVCGMYSLREGHICTKACVLVLHM